MVRIGSKLEKYFGVQISNIFDGDEIWKWKNKNEICMLTFLLEKFKFSDEILIFNKIIEGEGKVLR